MREPECGFTLLELMLALTITGVMVLMIFGALRVGVRAWERGERIVEVQERYRVGLDLIRQQVQTAHIPQKGVDSPGNLFFKGNETSLSFFSKISLVPGQKGGLVYAEYRVLQAEGGKKRLVFLEKYPVGNARDFKDADIREEDFQELIPDMADMAFFYLKTPPPLEDVGDGGEDAFQWENVWDSAVERNPPAAVRIRYFGDSDSPSIDMVIPLSWGSRHAA